MPQSKPSKKVKNTSMHMKTCDGEMNTERIYKELKISEQQVKEGRARDAFAALRRARGKYGL